MITMSFECPETHEPLRSMPTTVWTASDTAGIRVMHCPKCSQRHEFSRADAILSIHADPQARPVELERT
jgi:hypothetical protein